MSKNQRDLQLLINNDALLENESKDSEILKENNIESKILHLAKTSIKYENKIKIFLRHAKTLILLSVHLF